MSIAVKDSVINPHLDTRNTNPFIGDVYAFLLESIAASQMQGLRTIPIQLTCFDVNRELIVFGSNIGHLFVYKRKTKVDDTAHFITKVSNDSISSIHLIASELKVAIASQNRIIVWDLFNDTLVYSQVLSADDHSESIITALAVSIDQGSGSIYVLTGHSDGNVFRHSLDTKVHSLMYTENSSSNHVHQIVQLEIISSNLFLVSSCHRSAIVTLESDRPNQVVPIGRNERKNCGAFGAVHIPNDDLIYAARPRTHLVRADEISGQVLETFVLRKAAKPDKLNFFVQFRKSAFNGDYGSTELGRLLVLNSSSILSWTESNIMIVSIDGSVLANETDLIDISDVKCFRYPNEEFEVFILFKTRHFMRLRNFSHEQLVKCLNEDESEYVSCDDGDPFSDLNFQLPFKLPSLGVIEENLKQVIQSIQSKVVVAADSGYGLENSGRVEIYQEQPEYLKEGAVSDTHNDTLVVIRKKLKKKKKSITVQEDTMSGTTSNTMSSETSSLSSLSCDKSEPNDDQTQTDTQQQEQINDSDKLAMILAAFPSENEVEMSLDTRNNGSTKELIENLEVTLTTNTIPEMVEPENVKDDSQKNPESENLSGFKENEFLETKYQLVIPTNPYKFSSNVNRTYIKWNLIYSPINSTEMIALKCSLMSASGFNDESNEGAFLLFGSNNSSSKGFYTFPSFKRIKLPQNNMKVCTFSASPTKIVLLDDNGSLYIATDWLHPRFLLGVKWDKINTSRTGSNLIDASFSVMDSICWFIDDDGCSWVYRIKSSSWVLARNENTSCNRLSMITVSPQNSAIVWAADTGNQLYAREGIFNDKSDGDCLIAGIDWVTVEPVVGTIKLISASIDCLWVVSNVNGEDRLFKRIGIDPPSNYVGTEWEEVLLPLLIEDQVMRISSSLSGDLYLLTTNNLLYQYCIHETIPLKTVDDGWLLL